MKQHHFEILLSKSFKHINNRIDSIYEAPLYIYETPENNSNEESETPAYKKHSQVVFDIIRRYFECRTLNPKLRFCIFVLVIILVLLIVIEVISLSFIFKQ